MPSWEAKRSRNWKFRTSGDYKHFARDFMLKMRGEMNPFIEQSFAKMLGESGSLGKRMNSIEVDIVLRGRTLNKVV